jgi:4-hydroxythreonine-4-phosphate dehydrogenase
LTGRSRVLWLTPGDPAGIGPEVACRALLGARHDRGVVLLGAGPAITAAARDAGLPLVHVDDPLRTPPGAVSLFTPDATREPIEVASLRYAVEHLLAGHGSALVTGPIHKARLHRQGFPYAGHTDFLGHLCGVADPVMAFTGGDLRVALVTVHLPLSAVPAAVTTDRVLHTVRTAHRALREDLRLPHPRLLVCGLNPHAGDEGLLGPEDQAVIAPAVAAARAEGIDAIGPISAEAAFRHAISGHGDLVVAMYHDQGLAPLKLVDFGRSVNWTLGLPIVRTSVDHGTADDLVGTGRADPASMSAAIELAIALTPPG